MILFLLANDLPIFSQATFVFLVQFVRSFIPWLIAMISGVKEENREGKLTDATDDGRRTRRR